MRSTRPFREADVPDVADLHRRVFGTGDGTVAGSLDAYRAYFADVFLNQAICGAPASLVYERDGRIRAFLGIMLRPMTFGCARMTMAVCSQFVVDPDERGQVGLCMLKACFDGPQDLTISDEAGDNTRQVWEWCGGDSVVAQSLRWMKPLRPARFGLATLAKRRSLALLAGAGAADARMVDGLLRRLVPSVFPAQPPRGVREELDEQTFVSWLPELTRHRALRPLYDAGAAAWAFARANRQSAGRGLRRCAVRDESGDIVGWFLYDLSRDRVADVVQVAARRDALDGVLDHLLHDADRNGAVAVAGRLEPALMPALAQKRALFHHGPHWTLVHSPHPEIRHAVHRGDAFLTRLEGEWCLRFR